MTGCNNWESHSAAIAVVHHILGGHATTPCRVKVTGDLFHGQIPAGAVYVGRAAPGLPPSPYANPYPIRTYRPAESLRLYRMHAETFDSAALRRDLAGRDLACWCTTRPALPRRRAAGDGQPMTATK